MKKTQLLLSDEALALAACDAGVKSFYGYPGTPSTEIFESAERYFKKLDDHRTATWAANEKVAYELALGASYTGHRCVVTMKHVGLNVAMDAFVNSALTGVRGGLVLAIADDPSMHSSQNEQDSRYLGDFAHVPILEPSTPQEVYDFTLKAFAISESLKLPVVMRLVTRLAHSRGEITQIPEDKRLAPTCLGIPDESDRNNWILIPALARHRNRDLRNKLPQMLEVTAPYNQMSLNQKDIGIITAGIGEAYLKQYFQDNQIDSNTFNLLSIKSYPLNRSQLIDFLDQQKEVFIFEENYPYIEDKVRDLTRDKIIVKGRRDKTINFDGELSVGSIRTALTGEKRASLVDDALAQEINEVLSPRPPKLCRGCGHTDSYNAITHALQNIGVKDPRVFGDIGCYTLGVLPPHLAIHTCVEMGASLSMAVGAAQNGLTPSVGVIGDSTFYHSGIPTLLTAVKEKLNINLIVMDNSIVGMTGHQPPVATNMIENIAKAIGFQEDQIHNLVPLPKQTEENTRKLEEIFKDNRPSLIIFKRECIIGRQKKLYPHLNKEKSNEE